MDKEHMNKIGKATQFKAGEVRNAEAGRIGGVKSGIVRAEKRTIAEVLRKVLDEEMSSGATRLDVVVSKTVQALYDAPSVQQLKIIAELLGELEHKVKVDGPGAVLLPREEIDAITDLAK